MPFRFRRYLSVLIIWGPMSLAGLYYVFIAADRYVSTSIISVRQSGDTNSPAAGFALAFPGMNASSSQTDTLYLNAYIQSLDMLKHLDAKIGLRRIYEAEPLDFIFRLWPGTSQEWFLWYYRNRVVPTFDSITSLLTVTVEGFKPEEAQAINQEILAESERFVNEISHRIAREQMAFAENELGRSRERYEAAKNRLLDFQNRNQLFDPVAQAQAKAGLANELEASLTRDEAELKNQLTFLNEKSYQIMALRNRIAATRAQLEEERRRFASPQGERLNLQAAEFQKLTMDAGFAQDLYRSSLESFDNIRIEASRKLKSLVVIASPSVPELALYPRRLYNLLTLFLLLTLVYGITRLVIATVEDHRD